MRTPTPRTRAVATFVYAFAVLLFSVGLPAAWGQSDVLTQHNDNMRTGLNPKETILTPANVTSSKFGKLFMQSVDGIMAGQPLYVSKILMKCR